MAVTLYWHDYETFGQNPRWAGIAQFAGLRTDEALNEVGEPLMLYCQPPRDSWPDPTACLITGLTPQHCRDHGVPEPVFARRVIAELGRPGTCGVGFNSIRFDDEFTRHLLYRNFYDPYEREWKHENTRWDILDVLRMARSLRPEGMQWPVDEAGHPVMRLEQLAVANGVTHTSAHDALSDVRATLALARLLRQCQPKLYQHAFTLRAKHTVAEWLDCKTAEPVLHVSSRFGAHCLATALVMPLMPHPDKKNEVIVYDLMQAPDALLSLSAEEIRQRLFTSREMLEQEGVARIALKTVRLNKSPMLAPLSLLDDAVQTRTGIDRVRCEQHWRQILPHRETVARKLAAVFVQDSRPVVPDAEFRLYDGFIDKNDQQLCKRVRQADAVELSAKQFVFEDARLQELFFRYCARHFPATLTLEEQAQWHAFRQWRLNELVSPDWITREAYISKIAALQADCVETKPQQVLAALAAWTTEIDK